MRKPDPHQLDMLFAKTLFRTVAERVYNRLDPGNKRFALGLEINALGAAIRFIALADDQSGGLEPVKDTHKRHRIARHNVSQLGLPKAFVVRQE